MIIPDAGQYLGESNRIIDVELARLVQFITARKNGHP
jgi:hypothetical protein